MIGLPSVGTLSYNGVPFTGASEVKVSVTPVRDEANRTVVKHSTTLTVSAVITAAGDAPTDVVLEEIRARLTKQGQALIFVNRGFGQDLLVNTPGGQSDVSWGPVPEILEWNPVGSSRACEIVWKVTTHLPPKCTVFGIGQYASPLLAFNFGVSYDISDRGYTTRRISGYLEFAQTRVDGGRVVPLSADTYRNLIKTPQPPGFKRSQNWDLSKDKSRIDFSITDTQIESRNAYPEGVTNIKARHGVRWSRTKGQAMWLKNSLTAEIEVLPTLPPTTAWKIFLGILTRRMKVAKEASQKYAILESLEVDEDIFGPSCSFSAGWRITGGVNDFLDSGLWSAEPGTWDVWRTSIAAATSQYGLAGLLLQPYDDVIVDLCMNTAPDQAIPAVPAKKRAEVGTVVVKNETPPSRLSWLRYANMLAPSRTMPVSRQAMMQFPEVEQGSTNQNDTVPFSFNPSSQVRPDLIQKSGAGRYSVWLIGGAQRAGYRIPRPRIVSIGGQVPVEGKVMFIQRDLGKHFGVNIYEAHWAIEYILPSAPAEVPTLDNLEFQDDPPSVK